MSGKFTELSCYLSQIKVLLFSVLCSASKPDYSDQSEDIHLTMQQSILYQSLEIDREQ